MNRKNPWHRAHRGPRVQENEGNNKGGKKVMDLTGAEKKELDTERRLTVLEVNMDNQIPPKDIVSKLASISESINSLSDLNTAQHQESKKALDDLTDCIRGSGPHSLQSQIMTINERAFGDNPTSLKS